MCCNMVRFQQADERHTQFSEPDLFVPNKK